MKKFYLSKKIFFPFLVIIIAGLIFNYNLFTNIKADNDQNADEVENTLEKNRADREVFDSQFLDLQKNYAQLQQQLTDAQSQLTKAQDDLAFVRSQREKMIAKIKDLQTQRRDLSSELYMLSDNNKLTAVMYFLSPKKLYDIFAGKDQTQIIISQKLNTISQNEQDLKSLVRDQDDLVQKEYDLQKQFNEIQGRTEILQIQLDAQKDRIKKLDMTNIDLDQYLLGLGINSAMLARDFVSWNQAAGDNFQIFGGGTEHGLGMSQYGARGLAAQNKNYQQILTYYFQNTSIGSIDPNIQVKVGVVLGGMGGRIYVRGGAAKFGGFTIPADGYFDVNPVICDGADASGHLIFSQPMPGEVVFEPLSPDTAFEVSYKSSSYNLYRGLIRVNNFSGSMVTVNILNLEDYLRGVVAGEMPRSWPAEALKSQAVAARSYAFCNIGSGLYDVDDTTRYQVYLGKKYEFVSSNAAVDQTRGQVVKYLDQVIPAYYHSTSGGYTENNENVWGGAPKPWLRGVPSPWEENSPYWSWSSKVYSRAEISAIFAKDPNYNVGTIQSITILNRGVSGRVLSVQLIGDARQIIISGPKFKTLINQNSNATDPVIRNTLFGIK